MVVFNFLEKYIFVFLLKEVIIIEFKEVFDLIKELYF